MWRREMRIVRIIWPTNQGMPGAGGDKEGFFSLPSFRRRMVLLTPQSLNSTPWSVKEYISDMWKHLACGILLWQLQETNTSATWIHSCIVQGCIHTTKAELDHCSSDWMVPKAYNIFFLSLYRKSLMTLDADEIDQVLKNHKLQKWIQEKK